MGSLACRRSKAKLRPSVSSRLRYYGLDAIGTKQKDAVRKRIMEGWPFTPEERERILTYCLSDVDAMQLLLPRILPSIDLGVALHSR
jgi:DNA polymerase I